MRAAYVLRRPVVNSYLVRQRDRRRHRALGLVLLVTLPLVLAVLANLWLHVESLRAGYRIHRLESELETLAERRRRLELEASFLTSPQRVEAGAAKLGMAPPDLERRLYAEELE